MEPKQVQQQLLAKFLSDQCSREELEQLLTYLQHDQESDYAEVMQQVWEKLQTSPQMSEADADRIFSNILRRTKKPVEVDTPTRVRPLLSQWIRYAAILTGLVLGGVLYWRIIANKPTVYQTAYGETLTITLPDESVVSLNGNSKLSYKPGWDESPQREVWLEGEAFFSVIHTKHHQRFVVHTTRKADVEVLGTKFTVSDRQNRTRIVLNEGKVRLRIEKLPQQQQVEMVPGDMVVVQSGTNTYVKKQVNPQVYSSWTQQKLIFDNTPLSEVVTMLQDTYGLEVTVADSTLLQRQVSGSTPPIHNVDLFLLALSKSFNLDISKSENRVLIRGSTPNK